jgi:hypothetical protein
VWFYSTKFAHPSNKATVISVSCTYTRFKKLTRWTCDTHRGEKRCIQHVGGESDHFEDLGVNERIILECILRKSVGVEA